MTRGSKPNGEHEAKRNAKGHEENAKGHGKQAE